ncbi:MAG TPA: ketoacyl-ACP synthase III family protein [Streptosporangiaceae bacterium]
MRTPDIFLSGLGVFLPDTVSIESAVQKGLYSASDVELHGWTGLAVAGDIPAPEMALRASRAALERCGLDADGIGLLLYTDCWHQGPDGWQPQLYVQHYLVGGDLLAAEVRNGCNGTFSALELASSYLSAGSGRQAALIVASDNFGTPLVDRWNPGPAFIAGDAAAAMILTTQPGFARVLSVNSTTIVEAEEAHRCGEPMFPPTVTMGRVVDFTARAEAFRKRQFDEGTGMALVTKFQQKPIECIQRTLSEADIALSDVAKVVITNCSRDEAEVQFMGVLGLPLSKSTWEYGCTVGHLASADHIVSLDHLLSTRQIGPGDHVLVMGAAPGITYSCAVIEILSAPPWASAGKRGSDV